MIGDMSGSDMESLAVDLEDQEVSLEPTLPEVAHIAEGLVNRNAYLVNMGLLVQKAYLDDGDSGMNCAFNCAAKVECRPDSCESGIQDCGNRSLQLGSERLFERCIEGSKGYGVRSSEIIPPYTVIAEYWGDVIDKREFNRRRKKILSDFKRSGELDMYLIALDTVDGRQFYVDPVSANSVMRYVNNSCNPNCQFERWYVDGVARIAVTTLGKPVLVGEYLSISYTDTVVADDPFCLVCDCKQTNCMKRVW